MEPLLNGYRQLSQASNIPERTLRTMVKNGLIPHIKAGHRTIFFSPSNVEKALAKRTIREVA